MESLINTTAICHPASVREDFDLALICSGNLFRDFPVNHIPVHCEMLEGSELTGRGASWIVVVLCSFSLSQTLPTAPLSTFNFTQ